MISPTVGRIVWYRPRRTDEHLFGEPGQPLAAIVTSVHHDREVSLSVFSPSGATIGRRRVQLLQDDDPLPDASYAEWMPYQKEKANER
jgi:hypothetical protein